MSANLTCAPPFARGNGTNPGFCDCNAGYMGSDCTTAAVWFVPVQWVVNAGSATFFAFATFWALLKLIHTFGLQDKRSFKLTLLNLSTASKILNLLAALLRCTLRLLQLALLARPNAPPSIIANIFVIVLNSVSISSWYASLALIMGFWVDALHSKIFLRVATRTKILCFVAAGIVLLFIPGMILATNSKLFVIGAVIIVLGYFLDSIIFITVLAILRSGCCLPSAPSNDKGSKKPAAYAYRYMTIAVVMVALETVVGGLGGIIQAVPYMATLSVVLAWFTFIFEAVGFWATMMLVERKTGFLRVCRDVFTWTDSKPSKYSVPTSGSKKSSSSLSLDMMASKTTSTGPESIQSKESKESPPESPSDPSPSDPSPSTS